MGHTSVDQGGELVFGLNIRIVNVIGNIDDLNNFFELILHFIGFNFELEVYGFFWGFIIEDGGL
jgi:hypothetical protein